MLVAPSTSLMFLPVTTEGEDLPDGFQFAREKAAALATWAKALQEGGHPATPAPSVPEFPRSARSRPGPRERSGAPHRPTSTSPRSPPPPPGASPRPPRFAGSGCRSAAARSTSSSTTTRSTD